MQVILEEEVDSTTALPVITPLGMEGGYQEIVIVSWLSITVMLEGGPGAVIEEPRYRISLLGIKFIVFVCLV